MQHGVEWTDDMRVRLAPGESVGELVLFLRAAAAADTPRREVLSVLTERFALSFDDARLAMDRAVGGVVRASSNIPANEPDRVKDPVAWAAYRLALGLPGYPPPVTDPDVYAAAATLLEGARAGEPTRGTDNVLVALEVTRQAVASTSPDRTRLHELLEAATCISVAAETIIARIVPHRCAWEGSQEWVEGVALAGAARQLAAVFGAQPDPDLEHRGLQLVGRIVTQLLGQCAAHVGKAMLESARCSLRRDDRDGAAGMCDAVVVDFARLVDKFEAEVPYDEDVFALEHLLAALDLLIQLRGPSANLDVLRSRTIAVLQRASRA